MSVGFRYFPWGAVALLVLLSSKSALAAEAVAQKATVFGTPTANLRAGAGVEHELKLTLKEGDQVTIERLEGEWFLVTAADGQQGFIHRNLLKPAEKVAAQPQIAQPQKSVAVATPAPEPESAKIVAAPATKPAKAPSSTTAAAAGEVATAKSTDGKAPSLLQMLEAHELEVKIGLVVAGVAFVIGWFCGGRYYIWREHKYRRRLRL